MKKYFFLILMFLVAGCNSDSGGESDSDSSMSGIYRFQEAEVVIVINGSEDSFIFTDEGIISLTATQMTVEGTRAIIAITDSHSNYVDDIEVAIDLVSNTSTTLTWTRNRYDSTTFETTTAVFTDIGVRYDGSLSLAELSDYGQSIEDDTVTYVIDESGVITVNAMCTFSGELEQNGVYYDMEVSATSCDSEYSDLDGEAFQGVVFTLAYEGVDYMVLGATGGGWIAWDTVVKY